MNPWGGGLVANAWQLGSDALGFPCSERSRRLLLRPTWVCRHHGPPVGRGTFGWELGGLSWLEAVDLSWLPFTDDAVERV